MTCFRLAATQSIPETDLAMGSLAPREPASPQRFAVLCTITNHHRTNAEIFSDLCPRCIGFNDQFR